MICLDSSAVVKLVRQEAHSADLVAWIDQRKDEELVASALVEVGGPTGTAAIGAAGAHRSAGGARPVVPAGDRRDHPRNRCLLRGANPAQPLLGSLDAIHLATAQVVANESGVGLTAFVTYDQRLLAAAEAVGLPVACPGFSPSP